jgi:hypothetical protein
VSSALTVLTKRSAYPLATSVNTVSKAVVTRAASSGSMGGGQSGPVRVGPLIGDQAAMPAQDRGRSDQPPGQPIAWEMSAERAEQRSVSPGQPWLRVGSSQHCDVVTPD